MIRLPRFAIVSFLLALFYSPWLYAASVDDLTDGSPYYYQAAQDTEVIPGVGGPKGRTDSGINHLPAYHGHMMTSRTYRFVNVAEQVFTMIGDGKHGLWRYQDNGTVREYITPGSVGIPVPQDNPDTALDESDLSHPDAMAALVAGLSAADIGTDYSHFFKTTAPFAGYKANGNIPDAGGPAPFLDIPIFHERYAGRYNAHVPIDLAGYYCTMSSAGYAKARAAMNFAFEQPAAGKVGPLGQRAGLDVSQNYTQILRLHSFPDARIWANTESTDEVRWQEINTRKTKAEIYLVERPFFNEPFLFIVAVFDDARRGSRAGKHSYIRPHGPYYDHLRARMAAGEELSKFRTRLIHQPRFAVRKSDTDDDRINRSRKKKVHGFRLYGMHHPGEDGMDPAVAISNGACPSMGGDFGETYYGSAWPNNYQEVTPLCDGVVIDIKLYANLDGADWNNESKNLANNTGSRGLDPFDPLFKNYTNFTSAPAANPGTYGVFQDPYLINNGITNPDQFDATGTDLLKYPSANDQVEVVE